VDDALLDKLVEVGFDPVYGARPLKRAIQQQLENPLAQDILAGKFPPGTTIRATLEGTSAVFSVKQAA
jgi:ATP-dependent Clp protease ATP-binding subunit ClpB